VAPQSLFSSLHGEEPDPKPADDRAVRMRVLVTVKAAPNPSETYGETVCVAGVRPDVMNPGWVRLYPINFRDLDSDDQFRKYQIITLDARPARQDQRRESWRPIMPSIVKEEFLEPWKPRRVWLDDYVEDSMCRLNAAARDHADAKSLALVRPLEVAGLTFERHPGWTAEEQRKIDKYVAQPDLFNPKEKTPLKPPRLKARYRYRCHERSCNGHEQGLLDWEFVLLQRQLAGSTEEHMRAELQAKFVDMMCHPSRDVAFYVGNQAKRVHVFSVLGVYYPKR